MRARRTVCHLPGVSNRPMHKLLASLALYLAGACAQAVPTAVLNPDVTPATLSQTICRAGYTKTVRPSTSFTNGIKMRLFREQAKDSETEKASYELDHIVPLALGGHPRNLHNLALQPWEGPKNVSTILRDEKIRR